MMREAISGCEARCKRILLSSALFLSAIAIISLVLVYSSGASAPQAVIANSAPGGAKEPLVKEARREAVLSWMKKNSAMSEPVLSQIYGIASNGGHPDLVLAVCLVESNYNPRAVSNKGAIGLMGIMPGIWLDELRSRRIARNKEDLYKISNNIAAGTYVLDRYMAKTGNLRRALIRYEGGDSWYATRVMKAMRRISKIRNSTENVCLASAGDSQ